MSLLEINFNRARFRFLKVGRPVETAPREDRLLLNWDGILCLFVPRTL